MSTPLRERPDAPLGTLIFRAGLLPAETIESALEEGVKTGKRLGEILTERGLLEEADLTRLLAGQKGLEFVAIRNQIVDPSAAALFRTEQARLFHALPYAFAGGDPVVAISDPTDEALMRDVREALGREVRFVVATRGELLDVLEDVYSRQAFEHDPFLPPAAAVEPVLEAGPAPEPAATSVDAGEEAPAPPAAPAFLEQAPSPLSASANGTGGDPPFGPGPLRPAASVAAPLPEPTAEPEPQPAADPEPAFAPAVDAPPAPAPEPAPTAPADEPLSLQPFAPAADAPPTPAPEPAPTAPADEPLSPPPAFVEAAPEQLAGPALHVVPAPAPAPAEPPPAEPAAPPAAPAADDGLAPRPEAEPAPAGEPAAPDPDPFPFPPPDEAPPPPLPPAAVEDPSAPAHADGRLHRVTVRLVNGERVEAGDYADAAEATERAKALMTQVAASDPGDWPFVNSRFLKPDTIVSVDLTEHAGHPAAG